MAASNARRIKGIMEWIFEFRNSRDETEIFAIIIKRVPRWPLVRLDGVRYTARSAESTPIERRRDRY